MSAKGKKRPRGVVVNLSNCRYNVVRACVEQKGWKVDESEEGKVKISLQTKRQPLKMKLCWQHRTGTSCGLIPQYPLNES